MRSCDKLNNMLVARYDIDLLSMARDVDHIESVYRHYSDKIRGRSLNESPDMSKAFLISEAARMILREIAPRRKKKKGVS